MSLTADGFSARTFAELREAIRTQIETNLGDTVSVEPDTIIGAIVNVVASELASLELAMLALYGALSPSGAEGAALDAISEITGVRRLSASATTVRGICRADTGTIIPQGTVFALGSDSGDQFATDEAVTALASSCLRADIKVDDLANAHTYTIVVNGETHSYISSVPPDTKDDVAQELASLINAGGQAGVVLASAKGDGEGGIYVQSFDLYEMVPFVITVGSKLGIYTVDVENRATATATGPIDCPIGALTEIVTAVAGLDSVYNVRPGVRGRNTETDTELRVRRIRQLQRGGSATENAIMARVQEIDGVSDALIISNDGDFPDVDGRPPHSFELVVDGGDESDIAAKLYSIKPAGIQTFGSESEDVADTEGALHEIKFSRPEIIYIWVSAVVTKLQEDPFPTNGADLIRSIIADSGNSFTMGRDIVPGKLTLQVYSTVPGVADISLTLAIGSIAAPGPYSSGVIQIGGKQRANFDISRIQVNVL